MRLVTILALCLLAQPVLSVQPDEVLSDPALEARAREISRALRCPVCQGESIDDSNAGISRDLRLYVRERLVEGDSNTQVLNAVSERFGEFVLFEPPMRGINWLLYLSGPFMALLGLVLAGRYLLGRRGSSGEPDPPLSAEEEARIATLVGNGPLAEGPPMDDRKGVS